MTDVLSLGSLAQIACVLEATARKPGNVHRFRDFEGLTYLEFLLSAQAISAPLDAAPALGLGPTILQAVTATRRVVRSNTNLGLILALTPLCLLDLEDSPREALPRILEATTVDDARAVYQAIRLANPGGLGATAEQDVATEPTLTLVEVMRLASDRDSIARQYGDGYADVLDVGLPELAIAIREGRPTETAVILTHLRLMSERPDTLIARKRGYEEATESARRAQAVLREGWPDGASGRARLAELDAWLRGVGHARNPGTTADLVAAALFLALRDGTIQLPVGVGGTGWSSPDAP
ncbi:MAG: triphosphoribosyl-dephospho-CoA synthase [Isosphaeraceae bacterium]